MKLARCVCLLSVLLAPIGAYAQTDDVAYCDKLYDMAVRYRGKGSQGESKPTPDMIIAQDRCHAGRTAEGIATLEQLLRNGKITPPPR